MDRATVESLLGNCQTDEERRVVLALLQRENAKTDVLVTIREGKSTRRYVVDHEDRDEIRQFVGNEDARKPLSDSQIADMLKEQGIECARRTVAKYREALKIAPANLRKTL